MFGLATTEEITELYTRITDLEFVSKKWHENVSSQINDLRQDVRHQASEIRKKYNSGTYMVFYKEFSFELDDVHETSTETDMLVFRDSAGFLLGSFPLGTPYISVKTKKKKKDA